MGRTKKLVFGMVAFFILAAVPFLFYSYRLISTDTTEISILGFTIEAGAHGNMNYYAYYFLGKLSFLFAFIVWFLTSNHWWRYAILIPICMLIFQLCGLVNTSIQYIDEFDFWYSLPIVIPIVGILLTLSWKMVPYAFTEDLRDQMREEVENAKKDMKT
ncbi:hypothetical protein [Flagellimonas sp.]|uniref:hypothetical protein n=1 Tax=Flagellimonas sp. TaxID=2058762 RepID=UPI003BAA3909